MPESHEQRHQHYRTMGWWQDRNLLERYLEQVQNNEDALAVVDDHGNRLSHEQLLRAAKALAERMQEHGVSAGDSVLIVLPNQAKWQIAFLAVLHCAAIPATIPVKSLPQHFCHALGLIRCQCLITSRADDDPELYDTCRDAINATAGGGLLIELDNDGSAEVRNETRAGDDYQIQFNDVEHIAFTSSTTGLPKAVTHSANTLCALNQAFSDRFSLDREKSIFMASPLGHSVGAYHGARLSLFNGATLVLQDRWQPQQALEMIDECDCKFTAAATPFLKDLVDLHDDASSISLETFLCGGAPVPPVLMEQAWQRFPHTFISNLWGMTEGGLVTSIKTSPREKLMNTAGVGLPGLELQVIDENHQPLAAGEEGELVMRGPGVFTGYAGQQDLYQSCLTTHGFFRTGDLARLDNQGYVQITGRLKDLIIRGGVNISPIPIEDALARHPLVNSVAVIGFPDERLGEKICAVIQAKQTPLLEQELLDFCSKQQLAKRQLPEVFRFIREMPRTAGGKIRKPQLVKIVSENDPEHLIL